MAVRAHDPETPVFDLIGLIGDGIRFSDQIMRKKDSA